jgi:hypothetical protein
MLTLDRTVQGKQITGHMSECSMKKLLELQSDIKVNTMHFILYNNSTETEH